MKKNSLQTQIFANCWQKNNFSQTFFFSFCWTSLTVCVYSFYSHVFSCQAMNKCEKSRLFISFTKCATINKIAKKKELWEMLEPVWTLVKTFSITKKYETNTTSRLSVRHERKEISLFIRIQRKKWNESAEKNQMVEWMQMLIQRKKTCTGPYTINFALAIPFQFRFQWNWYCSLLLDVCCLFLFTILPEREMKRRKTEWTIKCKAKQINKWVELSWVECAFLCLCSRSLYIYLAVMKCYRVQC